MRILFLAVLLFNSLWLWGSSPEYLHVKVLSTESPEQDGSINFTLRCWAMESSVEVRGVSVMLPEGYSATMSSPLPNLIEKGSYRDVTYQLTYPTSSLPFYPVDIRFNFDAKLPGDSDVECPYFCQGKVFFSPWNSTEVWSIEDYNALPRIWLNRGGDQDTTRQFIPASDFPVSNLGPCDCADIWDEPWKDDIQAVAVEGSPFMVMMNPVHPDTIERWSSQGGDAPGFGGPLAPAALYTGTVRGRLQTSIQRAFGDFVTINLSGVQVDLMEADGNWWQKIGEFTTNASGDFVINYATNQILEGGELELFLNVKSKNQQFQVAARHADIQNYMTIYNQSVQAGNPSAAYTDNNMGNIPIQNLGITALHFASNSFNYFNNNGYPLSGLLIFPETSSGPNFSPVSQAGPIPTIKLTTMSSLWENTVYHEFGHYLMYRLQGNGFLLVSSTNVDCDHDFLQEFTSQIVWTEGFADAISAITDAAYFLEDGEHSHFRFQARPIYEDYGINRAYANNGIRVEGTIMAALYDLWDGDNKGLPAVKPFLPNSGYSAQWHGWADYRLDNTDRSWKSDDDVSFSLQQILQPITQQGIIRNIDEYYQRFLYNVGAGDCDIRAAISRCFRENDVVLNFALQEDFRQNTSLSSDDLFEARSQLYAGVICYAGTPLPYTDVYKANYYNETSSPKTSDFYSYPNYLDFISDPIWLGYIHPTYGTQTSHSLRLNPTLLPNPNPPFLPNAVNGSLYTCGGIDIEANNGTLELGGPVTTMDLRISDGSTLLLNSHGVLKVNNNSRLYVAPNATMILEPGARIELDGPNAVLEIDGHLIIRAGATFSFTGSGHVVWGNTQGGYNIACGAQSAIHLNGQQAGDLFLVLKDNARMNPELSLSSIKLETGMIRMGGNAHINTADADIRMRYIDVVASTASNRHKGFQVNGQADHEIRRVSISGATTAITAYQMWNQGATLRMDFCDLFDNEIGLKVHTHGAILTGCNFYNNITGWRQEMATTMSRTAGSKFNDNTYGIYMNSGGGDLFFGHSEADDNTWGIVVAGPGNIYGKCSSISNNLETGVSAGFGAGVEFTDQFDMNGSQMRILGNAISIGLVLPGALNLDFGQNDLVPLVHSTGTVVQGYMVTPCTGVLKLKERENHWNLRTSSPSVNYGLDYVIQGLYLPQGSNTYYNCVDPILLEDQQTIAGGEPCFEDPGDDNGGMEVFRYCPTCPIMETPLFEGIRLDKALRTATMTTTIANPADGDDLLAIQMVHEILHARSANPSVEEAMLLKAAYQTGKMAYNSAVSEGKIKTDMAANTTAAVNAIAMIKGMNATMPDASNLDAFYKELDKALTSHKLGLVDTAVVELDSVRLNPLPGFDDWLDYADCYLKAEQMVLEENLSREDFETALLACNAFKWAGERSMQDAFGGQLRDWLGGTASIVAFPNPASTSANISILSMHAPDNDVRLVDQRGQVHFPKFKMLASSQPESQMEIDLAGFAKGLYVVQVYVKGQLLSTRLVIQ